MKNLISLILALGLTAGQATAQSSTEVEIPAKVKEAFQKQYPDATNVEWETEGSHYEAEFKENRSEVCVVYDAEGRFVEKEVEIKVSEVPKIIADQVAAMGGKKISEASRITGADNRISYEVEVGEEDLIFAEDGLLIGQERESGEDDED